MHGFAAGLAVARRLLRETLPLAQGFPEHGLVAAVAGGARPGPAGGGGVPVSARPAVAADGAERLRQPRPLCPSRAGREGTAACPPTGGLALPAQARALRFAARVLAGDLPSAARRGAAGALPPGRRTAPAAPAHGREDQDAGRDHRADDAGGARTGTLSARRLGIHSLVGGNACRPQRREGNDGAVGPGTAALAGALGAHAPARTGRGQRDGPGASVPRRSRRIDPAPRKRRDRSWPSRTS